MTLELSRELLRFDQVVGEAESQTLVDRDLIVPDIKPDIARVLSVEGKVNITGKNVEQDRIAVEGMVNYTILYAAEGEPQPIYSMSQGTNFSNYIDVPGAMPKMEPEVKCEIEHIDFNKLNGRKLNMRSVLNMSAKVIDSVPLDAVKEVTGVPDVQILRDTVIVDEMTGDEATQTVVRGTIIVPEDIPPVGEILKCDAIVHKKEVKVDDGKIVITGSVFVPVLFSSKGEEVDAYRIEDDMVFTHTVEMPGITPEMACKVDYSVDDVYAEVKADEEEERVVDIEIVIGLRIRVTQRNEVMIILDAYSPKKMLECERRDVSMNLSFGENRSQAIVKEMLSIPDNAPEIEKVYDMACKPAITDYRVQDDKVIVEGVVSCDIIYLARGEGRLVSSFSEEVPFKTSVVVPGCKEYMKPEVMVDLESMDCTLMTKGEVEVKILLDCSAKLYDKISKDFIVKMEEAEGEVPVHKASITIYVVQPKDTLWKIAKRYFTTLDDIVKVNDLENPEALMPG